MPPRIASMCALEARGCTVGVTISGHVSITHSQSSLKEECSL